MSKVIELLDDIPESSVYGADADSANVLLKGITSVQELVDINIPNADTLLRGLLQKISSVSSGRQTDVAKLISRIPAIAVQDYFI